MRGKELEKQNFLTWCRYASPEEMEKAKRTNREALERLFNKYEDEIELTNKTERLYESISQHSIGVQKFDLSLKISK